MLTFPTKKEKTNISNIKGGLEQKDIFSETAWVCVLTYQIWIFKHN